MGNQDPSIATENLTEVFGPELAGQLVLVLIMKFFGNTFFRVQTNRILTLFEIGADVGTLIAIRKKVGSVFNKK